MRVEIGQSLPIGRADAERDDLGNHNISHKLDRFRDLDLIEWVHAHLHIGDIHPSEADQTRDFTLYSNTRFTLTMACICDHFRSS